ncbi:uncharacterized protein LOC114793464 [Denticeps clupeoides]|uniref:Methyltransferase type 11 domain-containing protein n=1 Tax=Denticeps clupeoides TaxID=299321 RepID=A0AAY4AYX0_9TELE|nr:uncharacterized protein LOC114793464 [Denticeps clupeoides]XP_028841072.1 uncharacterized protein LOC114793464 [Denticeps clupeoides]
MTHHRLFAEKHHASIYQMYRFEPPNELKELILLYLEKKKGKPHSLAVDLGCGTGQNTRPLAPYFQEVVGIDVSESQVEEAKAVPGYPNISYRAGPAEVIPFPDCSVDLITAASAAHWFDADPFLKEANRALKPHGCMALLGYTDNFKFHYQSCGGALRKIFEEFKKELIPFTRTQVAVNNSRLQYLYDSITYPEKERLEMQMRYQVPVKRILGFIESFSTYQDYLRINPKAAEALLQNTTKGFLEEMGVTSTDTDLELEMDYYCVLTCKPQ